MSERGLDFYQKLRGQVNLWARRNPGHKWTQYILVVPDFFHLLCKLALDKDVPAAAKARLAIVIGYIMLPLDLLPEVFLGPLGYLDDLSLAAWAVDSLFAEVNSEVILSYWAGESDLLEKVKSIIADADEMIGSGRWSQIKAMLRK